MSRVREWLPKILVESALIVFSILLALGVNQWKGSVENRRLAVDSLHGFEREILRNRERLEGDIPYHLGLRSVLTGLESSGTVATPADFRSSLGIDGFRPSPLLDTAWKTALATGALTHMDYETVAALSLTYGMQERFQETSNASLPGLIRNGTVPVGDMREALRGAVLYLNDLTADEQELQAVYDQALAVIRSKRASLEGAEPETVREAAPLPGD